MMISSKASPDQHSTKPFFSVNTEGVFYHGFHEGEPLNAAKICSPLRITGITRDALDESWGYLLEFSDPDQHVKRWVMPAKMLSGDGNAYRAELLGMGLKIEPGLKVRNLLTTYIQTAQTDVRVRCVDRLGWHRDQYVLPDQTIGKASDSDTMLFQSTGGIVSKFNQKGTLEEWKTHVANYCQGNSRLVFSVSVAFASTLLSHSGVTSGGFHIWGDSSTGKSTACKVAGSVFGGHNYQRNWRITDNALETVAALHSDALLVLDEIAQIDPKVVGDTVYMLANEVGKSRSTQTSIARKALIWRLLFLSDGEVSLANHMAEAGKNLKGGHDVRMAHITADAGKGYGVFDTLHSFKGGAELSTHLVTQTSLYYGTPALAFIQEIANHSSEFKDHLPQKVAEQVEKLCPPHSHGQVKRVAARFALVGIAGELATHYGITGWEKGEALEAAKVCFTDWLASRGGFGDVELDTLRQLLPNFIGTHGSSRFIWWHRANDDHGANINNRAGFKRFLNKEGKAITSHKEFHQSYGTTMNPDEPGHNEVEYFILPEVFQQEICKGVDYRKVAKLYVDLGVIIPSASGGKMQSATRTERLPTLGIARCYKIAPDFMSLTQH
jgi:putative DNA primase/helicase